MGANGSIAPALKLSARAARTGEVLDHLRQGRAETIAELAGLMGLARSTVAERVDLLLDQNLVRTAGETTPSRGRPASILAFNGAAGVVLVAQVGMSGTMVAVTDLTGEVLWASQVDLDVAEGPQALVDLLESEFERALGELGAEVGPVYGAGVGLPGDIEIAGARSATGTPLASWATYPLAGRLRDRFDRPVLVDHDVNFLALGEHRSCFANASIFLSLKVGTVIACGLVIDGSIVRGASGMLGEIGHTKVHGHDAPCLCGSRGCLNTVAGGHAIAARLREDGFDVHSAKEVAELANGGVVPAAQAVRAAGREIGDVMAAAINLLNPDAISVWGYLVDSGDQFLAGMQESIYRAALPSSARNVQLLRSAFGDDAGLRGAALSVIEHTLTPEAIDAQIATAVAA